MYKHDKTQRNFVVNCTSQFTMSYISNIYCFFLLNSQLYYPYLNFDLCVIWNESIHGCIHFTLFERPLLKTLTSSTSSSSSYGNKRNTPASSNQQSVIKYDAKISSSKVSSWFRECKVNSYRVYSAKCY